MHHGLGCLFRNRSLIARPDVWHHKTLRATQILPRDDLAVTIIVVRHAITALEARALSAWTKLVRCVLHRVPRLLLILDCDGMLHSTRHLVRVDQASVVSIWRMPTLLRRCHSLVVLLIAQEIFPRGAVKHLLCSLCKSCSSTRLLLFEICIYLSLLLLELVDHLRIKAHALDHVLAFLITVLVVKFFDQLEKVVVDLSLVSFCDRFLLLSVNSDLGLEKSLWIWPLLPRRATCSLSSKLL